MRFKHYSLRTERMYQECSHKVVRQPNGALLGICQCSPASCTSYTVLPEVECSSLKLRRIWKILPACVVWVAQTWSLRYEEECSKSDSCPSISAPFGIFRCASNALHCSPTV